MKTRLCLGFLLVLSCVIFATSCGDNSSGFTPQVSRVAYLSVSDVATNTSLAKPMVARSYQAQHEMMAKYSVITETVALASIKTDGTDERVISGLSGGFDDPAITADGKKIVFVHTPGDGNPYIASINIDGTGGVALTDGKQFERWPTVSPTGDRIYYTDRTKIPWQIISMKVDGTDKAVALLGEGMTDVCQHEATVSPDGNYLVLNMHGSNGQSYDGMYVVRIDGTEPPIKIAEWEDTPLADGFLSADETKVYFTSWDSEDNFQLFSADLTGARTQMTSGTTENGHPVVLGKTTVYMGGTADGVELFTFNSAGSPVQVTQPPTLKTFHMWLLDE